MQVDRYTQFLFCLIIWKVCIEQVTKVPSSLETNFTANKIQLNAQINFYFWRVFELWTALKSLKQQLICNFREGEPLFQNSINQIFYNFQINRIRWALQPEKSCFTYLQKTNSTFFLLITFAYAQLHYSVIDKAVFEITIIDAQNYCKTLNGYENISRTDFVFKQNTIWISTQHIAPIK